MGNVMDKNIYKTYNYCCAKCDTQCDEPEYKAGYYPLCYICHSNKNRGHFWSKKEIETDQQKYRIEMEELAASYYDLSKKTIDFKCEKCSSSIYRSTVKLGDKGIKEIPKGVCRVCMNTPGSSTRISWKVIGQTVPEDARPISWTLKPDDDFINYSSTIERLAKKYVTGQYMENIICCKCDRMLFEVAWNYDIVSVFGKTKTRQVDSASYCESCYDKKTGQIDDTPDCNTDDKIDEHKTEITFDEIQNRLEKQNENLKNINIDDSKDDFEEIEKKLNDIETELDNQNENLKNIILRNEQTTKTMTELNVELDNIEKEVDNVAKRSDIPNVEKRVKSLKRNFQDEFGKVEETEGEIEKTKKSLHYQSELTRKIATNLKEKNDKKRKQAGDIISKIKEMIIALDNITSIEQNKIIGLKRSCNQYLDDIQLLVQTDKELIDKFRNSQDEFDKTFN
eukprot:175359_1